MAITWALLFAALSWFWAPGGTIGIDTIGGILEAQGRARDPDLIAILWITGALKALLAIPPLILLLHRRHHRTQEPSAAPTNPATATATTTAHRSRRLTLPRLAHVATLLIGGALTLYALALLVQHTLMALNVVALPTDISHDENRWHLLLWDPIWLIGGLCFLRAARPWRRPRA